MSKCCIIIPCYNESSRLDINTYKTFFLTQPNFDVYFIDDGSTDNTLDILEQLKSPTVFTEKLTKNVGKAEAIRHIVLKLNQYDYLGYLDADLSTSLDEMQRLIEITKKENKTFVLGSRIKLINSSIKRKAYRHLFGRLVATFIDQIILKLEIYDTQCGAKVLKTDFAKTVFKEPFKSKWLFDVELLARAKTNYNLEFCKTKIAEVPLKKWHDTNDTRITLLDFLNTPFQLLKLYKYYG